jgi:hypothetical protein
MKKLTPDKEKLRKVLQKDINKKHATNDDDEDDDVDEDADDEDEDEGDCDVTF